MSATSCKHAEVEEDVVRGQKICTSCGIVLEEQKIITETQFQPKGSGLGSNVVGRFVNHEGGSAYGMLNRINFLFSINFIDCNFSCSCIFVIYKAGKSVLCWMIIYMSDHYREIKATKYYQDCKVNRVPQENPYMSFYCLPDCSLIFCYILMPDIGCELVCIS